MVEPAPNPAPECALALPAPRSPQEERALVSGFVSGIGKLFEGGDPETRQRLMRAMRHPVDCPRCAAACHIFQGSGRDRQYLPGVRGGILRRIYHKYVRGGGRLSTWWHGEVELDWTRIARLAQLAYSCNQCERCSRSCHSADHALVARQLRHVFREMGIAPPEQRGPDLSRIREQVRDLDEDTSRRAGIEVRTRWDLEDAEVLLLQPASAVAEWPQNVAATALLLTAAGLRWTLSSELTADDPGGTFAEDSVEQLKRARRTVSVARRLRAKRIVAGESGAAYRALYGFTPRGGEDGPDVARDSAVTLIRDLVRNDRLQFDPVRNDFPVTLHDPCQLVQQGVLEPQREVLRRLCPQFREMDPWAEQNYCCGGGGLTTIDSSRDWRVEVSGAKKMEQVREAFSECLDAGTRKYLCAPCADCTKQLRALLERHAPWEGHRIRCGGLAELAANALVAVRPGFLDWENR